MYSNTYVEDRTETLANGVQLSFGCQTPSKMITDANEWGVAWNMVSATYVCAYPHLEPDIRAYRAHMQREFASVRKAFYSQVINYDKAVRARIAGVRTIHFSEFHLFSDLRNSHINDTGSCIDVASLTPSSASHTVVTKSSVPCNNWNVGRCTSTPGKCPRLHICNPCETPGHRSSKCPHVPSKPDTVTSPSIPPRK
ncbi:hypothetical protein D9758_007610 [Tetrapyrgos nigripes]|uniref:C3H1-type domain-containing protein n=1 Tax=Tetrapyrgos nigripes TaxID=182062 RepID=A0A8H5LK19_9AGAR|nr:hypothetical protein D9758_007610 [Tetrapyrgos nigripes]